ncbi:GldG family protein [Bacteriovoracaceae bacterium]|nr:GldG family protein [Bacteriovoracaceae bacterium]
MRMQGKPVEQSWGVITQAQEFFTIKEIKSEDPILAGIDILLVIHPKGFEETQLYAIDQFILRGGKVLMAVDPFFTQDKTNQMAMMGGGPQIGIDENIVAFMSHFGIKTKGKSLAGDRYISGVGRLNPNLPPARLLPLVQCDHRCTSSYKDPMAKGLNEMTFVFPGGLTIAEKNVEHSFQVEAVISSTEKGNFYEVSPQELGNTANLWAKFQEGSEPVYFALKSFGKYKSFFPQGPPVNQKTEKSMKKEDSESKTQHLIESQKESAILVVSDVDFLADAYSFKRSFLGMAPANDNSKFLLNALEALSGNSDLLSVRSKGAIDRGFDVIDDIEFASEEATKQKVVLINGSISNFQKELDMLGKSATQENFSLLQNEGVRKKKQLLKKIASLKKELRAVKREGREQIENLGKWLQLLNTLGMPLLIFGFGFIYNRNRRNRYQKKIVVKSQINPTFVQGEQA